MNLNFNFPDLIPDPTYSFTTPPSDPQLLTNPAQRPAHNHQGSSNTHDLEARNAADAMYDERLRRALSGGEGGEEDLPEQEERVYRAEVSRVCVGQRLL